jgi:uncharacterized protein
MKKSMLPRAAIALGLCFGFSLWLLPGPAGAKPKPTRVEVRTTTFGGSSYILGFAACDLLNKNSAWVRGAVLESTGSAENIRVVARDPKKRARTFFTCSVDMYVLAKKGAPPFDKNPDKIKDLKVLAFQQAVAGMIITLDPNIRTLADLKGKRVATWPKGTTKFDLTYSLIAGAGKAVADSTKWQFTGYAGYSDMILGKTDAAFGFLPERGPGVYTTVPKLKELMSKRRVYFVSATPAMRARSLQEFGKAYGATATVKKGALGKDIPRQDIMGINIVLGWTVYPQMPQALAYEIVKVMYANRDKFKGYHGAGKNLSKDRFGAYPAAKEQWHPGARKFFDEQGIPYGQEHFDQVYPAK